MRFVVTGSPRSATRYAAVLFERLGVPCTHEQVFRQTGSAIDVVRWYKQNNHGDSSWLAWAFLDLIPGPVVVFHTRRNPWKVIDSMAHRNRIVSMIETRAESINSLRDVMNAYCPRVAQYDTEINRAAAFMLDWNDLIEEAFYHGNPKRDGMIYRSYRVESLNVPFVHNMLADLGLTRTDEQVTHALDPDYHKTNRGRVVTKKTDLSGLSNPDVARYIEERWGAEITSVQVIASTDDAMSGEELAEQMAPELLDEVNRYAERFDYPTVEQPVAA